MYKLVVLPLLFAAVSAGYLGGHLAAAPVAYAAPAVHAVHAAPVAYAAPVAVKAAPVATSYANVNQVSISHPVAAPAVLAAPVHAAPVLAAPVAKVAYAAPLAYGHGYHG